MLHSWQVWACPGGSPCGQEWGPSQERGPIWLVTDQWHHGYWLHVNLPCVNRHIRLKALPSSNFVAGRWKKKDKAKRSRASDCTQFSVQCEVFDQEEMDFYEPNNSCRLEYIKQRAVCWNAFQQKSLKWRFNQVHSLNSKCTPSSNGIWCDDILKSCTREICYRQT